MSGCLGQRPVLPCYKSHACWCGMHTWAGCHFRLTHRKRQGRDSLLHFPSWLVKTLSEKHQTSMEKNFRWKQIISKETLIFQKIHNCSMINDEMEAERPGKEGETKAGASEWTNRESQPCTISDWKPAPAHPSPWFPWRSLSSHEVAGRTRQGSRKQWSPVDLKGVPDDANFNVFLQSREEEHQEIARQLREEKQVNEELTAQITHLQIEEVPLQCENSNLQSEVQHLKLNPQMLPELQQAYVKPLGKKQFQEEMHCLVMNKQLLNVSKYMNSTCQICILHRKMAEDMGKELEKGTSFDKKKTTETTFYEKGA